MKYTVSTKKFKLSSKIEVDIARHIAKIVRVTPIFPNNFILLDITIRKEKKNSLDHTENTIRNFDINPLPGHPIIDNPVFYDGTLHLVLPIKSLTVHFRGKTPDEALQFGFERLVEEIDVYKGKHIPSDSEYKNHKTIRGGR